MDTVRDTSESLSMGTNKYQYLINILPQCVLVKGKSMRSLGVTGCYWLKENEMLGGC